MSAQVLHKTAHLLPDWAAPISSELDLVDRRLESVLMSDVDAAFGISVGLLSAGGKRVRPALVLLTAFACNRDADRDRAVNLAAAMELVHMASLVHDDVVDERLSRRGAPTANASWGNKISVLGGDYLLSKAFHLLSTYGSPEILRALSATAVQMTESEILQASGEGDLSVWEANYWRIIHGKTAEFMGACCECGAFLTGADPRTRESLREYGVQVGLAFQITDDVLDIVGNRAHTGKETGTDLAHGKFTLPVLLALTDADEDGSLRGMLAKGKLTRSEAEEVAAHVIESGSVDSARLAALDRADAAIKQLSGMPRSEYTDALTALAGSVISREG